MNQPKLIDQLRSAIRLRNYSPRTEEAYWHWIKKFILFHNKRHPNDMGEHLPTHSLFISVSSLLLLRSNQLCLRAVNARGL
jgi:hypothetical protein